MRSNHESEALVRVAPPVDVIRELTGVDIPPAVAAEEHDAEVALVQARRELDDMLRANLGEDDFNVLQETMENATVYDRAEKTLLQRLRRSRIAMLGFGALSALCLTKSAQHLASGGGPTGIFLPLAGKATTLTYSDPNDCYVDPAGAQLVMDGIYRTPEPGDDASVGNCLQKQAGQMREELEEASSRPAVKPYVSQAEYIIDDIDELAEQPGDVFPDELNDRLEDVQESILSKEDHLSDEIMAGLWYAVGAIAAFAPTGFRRDDVRNRKKAVQLLDELAAYKHQDVVEVIKDELYHHPTKLQGGMVTVIGTGEERQIVLLPDYDADDYARLETLREVLSALKPLPPARS
jgi:hypothetical protein